MTSWGLVAATLGGLLALVVRRWTSTGGVFGWGTYLAVAGAVLVGLDQGSRALDPPCHPSAPCGLELPRSAVIEGWIVTQPVARSGSYRFDLDAAAVEDGGVWRPLSGTIRVWVRELGDGWGEGDCLRARVFLRRPRNFNNPGRFDYVRALRWKGIRVTGSIRQPASIEPCVRERDALRGLVGAARRRIASRIDAVLAPEPAAIVQALLLGDHGQLSRSLRTAYARAGTAHLLAISGLHLGVVGGLAFAVLRGLAGLSEGLLARGLAPRLAALGAVPPTLAYAALAGFRAPTLRASFMIIACLVAVMCGRRSELLRSLAIAALAISLLWPGAVFEASFAFSFVAVASIGIGMRHLRVGWSTAGKPRTGRLPVPAGTAGGDPQGRGPETWSRCGWRLAGWCGRCLAVSFFAAVGTAPLSAFHFNIVSLVGPVANLVAVPLFSLAVVAALGGAALCGFGDAGYSGVPFWIAGAAVEIADAVVRVIAGLPGAAPRVVTPTILELGIAYGVLACFLVPRRYRAVLVPVLAVLALGDAAYWLRERYARPVLRVTFLDVGQGDATVVEFPGSAVLVIDGGGFPGSDFDPGEAIVARFLWSRKIARLDYVAMSHPDVDHAGGLPFLIEQFRPREFWGTGRAGRGAIFERLERALASGPTVTRALSHDEPRFALGGVEVSVLHPPPTQLVETADRNDDSLVLRLRSGRTALLFGGDVEWRGEERLAGLEAHAVRSSVLKVSHHGSRTSSAERFIDAVSPDVAVFSLGAANRYGFPHPEVIGRYVARGICVRRTDVDGAIVVHGTPTGYRVYPPCGR